MPSHRLVFVFLFTTLLGAQESRADEPPAAKRPAWTMSRISGSPVQPDPYRVAAAFPRLSFDKPTCVEELPDGRLLVTEMGGKVFSFSNEPEVVQPDLLLDLRALLPPELAMRGVSLFDAELHPSFGEKHFLFVCYVHPEGGGRTRVSRFTLDGQSPPRAVPGSEQVIITWPAGGHNGGCLEFSPDGYLYISTGDGSGPNPPDALTTGQDVLDLLGAILRIDVDHPTGDRSYSVPADNPLVGLKGARSEIWAYGLRNPWKFGVDEQTGEVFAADNGWETWEMVHRIVRGTNCGWPVMEGRMSLRSEVKPGPTPIVPPVKDHPHTEANSVIGGPVYRGARLPGLAGSFVYGDYITGTLWALRPDEDGSFTHSTLVDTDLRIVAFTETRAGRLFVLDYDYTGQIYELHPSDEPDTSASFPRRLSDTGLFESLKDLQPAPGVVPYEVIVERWVDGAQARRWVAIPGNDAIQPAGQNGAPAYPDGTVFVNYLSLANSNGEPVRLETQILHYERGSWRPYSYLWDDAAQDAQLVEPMGSNRNLRLPNATASGAIDRTWHVNAVNECKACHNAESGYVLGFKANQLNRRAGQRSTVNQLAALAALGVLSEAPTMAADNPSHLVDPRDLSASLNDRARSYLHVNCAVCHKPGGNAIVSFYLRRDLSFDKLNTNKGTGIGTFGLHDARIIAAGDPYRSLLLYRMSKLGYARMPYIGSRVVDSVGVSLVEEWIKFLPAAPASAPVNDHSAESIALRTLIDGQAAGEEREAAVRELLKTTAGALALAVEMHRGKVSGEAFRQAVSLGAAAPSSDVRGLFETFVPESQRRATLGPNIDPDLILRRQGDRQRGKLIYFSDAARCRACHELNGRDKSLGPTLAEINRKYPSRGELLIHVLRPSQKIDDPFAAYQIVTTDGRLLSGLLIKQDEREVVLKTVEKQALVIGRNEIDEIMRSPKSLMPDGVLSDLTAQEAADLLAYVQSCVE